MPFDPRLPFTRAEALTAGLTVRQLRGRRFRTVLTGVYVDAAVHDTPLLRARAALMVHPAGAVATHFSAARLVGAPVPRDPDEHVTVARPADRRHRTGIRCHVAALPPADVRDLDGVLVSGPHRMFVELAAYLPLVELVVLGDWLVRRRFVTVESLQAYCARTEGRHARAARLGASYVRARVDSPMETRLRLLLVLAGLPEPTVNYELCDEHGTVLRRLDLSWPDLLLAVEYDGRHHLEDAAQWESDVERREELGDERWRLITITSRGVYRRPEVTVSRVYEALRARRCPGLKPPGDGWRPHFTP